MSVPLVLLLLLLLPRPCPCKHMVEPFPCPCPCIVLAKALLRVLTPAPAQAPLRVHALALAQSLARGPGPGLCQAFAQDHARRRLHSTSAHGSWRRRHNNSVRCYLKYRPTYFAMTMLFDELPTWTFLGSRLRSHKHIAAHPIHAFEAIRDPGGAGAGERVGGCRARSPPENE